jgi:superfamily I DNA and RNA helicase
MLDETFISRVAIIELGVAFMLAMQMFSTRIRSHRNIFFLFFCLSLSQSAFIIGWFAGKNL